MVTKTSKMLNVDIDGLEVTVEQGSTILEAAKHAGKKIPTLCALKDINYPGSCRVCVVQIEGEQRMAAACNTPVCDGMKIHTNTPQVIRARKKNLEMLLSEHRDNCTSCSRVDTCALKALAADLCVDSLPITAIPLREKWNVKFPLQRDNTKCIKCMRCVAYCQKVQNCGVWDFTGTGAHMKITVKDALPIENAGCALCGQCVTHCPTGALGARNDIDKVVSAITDPNCMTVVQVAPAVRSSWGEGLGIKREDATQGKMVSALRKLGFDYIYDTDFAADLTIMEEGSELVGALRAKAAASAAGNVEAAGAGEVETGTSGAGEVEAAAGREAGVVEEELLLFTSCCPGWVRFAKQHYPWAASRLSSAKSPHQMLGAVIKHTMQTAAKEQGKNIFCVSIMPCIAKKYECDVSELATSVGKDVDAVLSVRELDRILRMFSIECEALQESAFDEPLGTASGAGVIFGRTGGVMEAALRTAAYIITGKNPDFDTCDCTQATPQRPWTDKVLDLDGLKVHIAIASGLGNASRLLDAIKAGHAHYDFVEIMACPGGCVAGGGQPISFNEELGCERAKVLNNLDSSNEVRRSHENPQIQKLYKDWLGEPLSKVSHEWLHTNQETWQL